MTLTEFLLARIAEDEAQAREEPHLNFADTDFGVKWRPRRVLAECEAKRRIVAHHEVLLVENDGRRLDGSPGPHGVEPECAICGLNGVFTTATTGACETVAHLATVYADHPDYRDEWRP